MENLKFIEAFYKKATNKKALLEALEWLSSSTYYQIKAIPFYSKTNPLRWLPNTEKGTRSISLIEGEPEFQNYVLSFSYKEKKETKTERGVFFVCDHGKYKNVRIAFTVESSEFFNRGLMPLFESFYPKIVMTFITHKKLRKLMEEFKEKNNFEELIIKRASHRMRFEEKGRRREVVPMVSWPDMEVAEAFEWVYQNNGWFQSLQFEAKKRGNIWADIYFSRQGVIKTRGLFGKVFGAFITPVCKIIYDNIEIFGRRGRRENRNWLVRPLAIDFGINQFEEPSENENFIEAMKLYKKASISVLHNNPYIQISVIDYYDGSTFDIWVLRPDQIYIVPQMKGSIEAIKRLINHIFDEYAEGDIKDYQEIIK